MILTLKTKGIGILITDHNVRDALTIIDKAYVMYDGTIVTSGTSSDILADEFARKIYFGNDINVS